MDDGTGSHYADPHRVPAAREPSEPAPPTAGTAQQQMTTEATAVPRPRTGR